MGDARKRWDTDDRFTGVADASVFAPALEELAALARRPGWVAEDPAGRHEARIRRRSVAHGDKLKCRVRSRVTRSAGSRHARRLVRAALQRRRARRTTSAMCG
jgi:hypothetical protein